MDVEIVRLPKRRRAEAAVVLASAFARERSFRRFFPDDVDAFAERVAAHFRFGCDVRAAYRYTFLAAVREDRVVGVVVFVSMETRALMLPVRIWYWLRSLRDALRIGRRTMRRMERFSRAMLERHPEPAYFYVGYLGVQPSDQASGVGAALLAAAYEAAREYEAGLVLDTFNPVLAQSLERRGWKVEGPIACGPVEGYSCHRPFREAHRP